MSQAVLADTFEDAIQEALAYNRMGALDDQIVEDIAHDYDVDKTKLREAIDSDG